MPDHVRELVVFPTELALRRFQQEQALKHGWVDASCHTTFARLRGLLIRNAKLKGRTLGAVQQLLMRNQVTRGYFVRARNAHQQLHEINRRYDLVSQQRPFSRCMACNGEIHEVAKKEIESLLLPETIEYYDRFFQCSCCMNVYWQGSHYKKMKALVDNINSDSGFSPR